VLVILQNQLLLLITIQVLSAHFPPERPYLCEVDVWEAGERYTLAMTAGLTRNRKSGCFFTIRCPEGPSTTYSTYTTILHIVCLLFGLSIWLAWAIGIGIVFTPTNAVTRASVTTEVTITTHVNATLDFRLLSNAC
jgi:hypothetical protein